MRSAKGILIMDCRTCLFYKARLASGYWEHGNYTHPRTYHECTKTFKVIKTVHRRCSDYMSTKQVDLFGVKAKGRPVR